jgi:TonB family protein
MTLNYRLAPAALAIAGLTTTAMAGEPATTAAEPRLLNLPEVVTADDYPREALDQQEQGAVAIRLVIGPDGHVSKCTVEKSSGSRSLDATSCRIYVDRARYEPVAASTKRRVVRTRVDWRMSSTALSRRGWFQRTTMAIRADGTIASCRYESSEAPDTDCTVGTPFPAAVAANFVGQVGYDPAKLVTETRFYPDGVTPEEAHGLHLLSRRAAKIVVKRDGRLQSCEVIEDGGSPEARESVCREARQYRYEALAKGPKAKGAIYFWTYLEPKPEP